MEQLLSPSGGLLLVGSFGLMMFVTTALVTKSFRQSRTEFLLAGRSMRLLPTAMSIAASWIWAPSLFVAAQKAYQQGVAGIFWFTVPNFLCLVIFGPMAYRLRQKLPDGFTLPQYIHQRHGRGVHTLYLIQFFGLQIGCFAVQLLAGAGLIHAVSGLPFSVVAVLLAVIPLTYAAFGGMRASIATDFLQMVLILGIILVTVPWAIAQAGGWDVVVAGVGGATEKFGNVFDPWIAFSFGIPVTISLLSGPLGDQMQWQRGFVLGNNRFVIRTYIVGALLFITVPLSLSLLGFTAAGMHLTQGWEIADAQMVGPQTIARLLPWGASLLFVVMILCGLCSTLDSVLCAVSSLVSADLIKDTTDSTATTEANNRRHVYIARLSMIVVAALALGIAHIPGLKVLHLFLFYGTWRASTMIPTVLTLFWSRLEYRSVFVAILGSLIFGAPVLAVGNALDWPELSVMGSLLVVTISIVCCVGGTWLTTRRPAVVPEPESVRA